MAEWDPMKETVCLQCRPVGSVWPATDLKCRNGSSSNSTKIDYQCENWKTFRGHVFRTPVCQVDLRRTVCAERLGKVGVESRMIMKVTAWWPLTSLWGVMWVMQAVSFSCLFLEVILGWAFDEMPEALQLDTFLLFAFLKWQMWYVHVYNYTLCYIKLKL